MDGPGIPGSEMVNVLVDVRAMLSSVVDPEIPVLTIEDLGILRSVDVTEAGVQVTITPTYSGCPAMRQIEDDIVATLRAGGYDEVSIKLTHDPPWSTDWISEEGRAKLAQFGIAPPSAPSSAICPRCAASHPRMVSRFGSTACKALMVCSSCGEPFDLFKEF